MSAKIVEMSSRGKSAAQVANALDGKVTRQAVLAHLKVKGLRGQPPKTPKAAADEGAAIVATLAATPGAGIDFLRGLESRLRTVVEVLLLAVEQLEANPTQFKAILDAHIGLVERIDAMTPRPPPDPELDPFNVESRRRLVSKLDRAVKAHEEKLRCVHCGEHPWRSVG
jgi:hypothetical protein